MDALGRRALVAVARLRHLDEHLVRDDVRRRRVDAVLRRVRVGQEEALDLGEGDGDRRRRVGRRRERPDAVPAPLGPDLGRGGGRDLLGRDLRDRRALGRDERGRARRHEAVGRRLAEGHGALVRRDVGVDRAGLDELEVLLPRALPPQQRAELGARDADEALFVQRLFQVERRDHRRRRYEGRGARQQRGAK